MPLPWQATILQLKPTTLEIALPTRSNAYVLAPEGLEDLVAALHTRDMRVVGPTLRDGVIQYREIDSATDLPIGWGDRQEAATYRVVRRDDEARFGYALGPHSWKQELFPSRLTLWRGKRSSAEPFTVEEPDPQRQRVAFLGMRPCELAAIAIQDRVFTGGQYVDRDYLDRRQNAFLIAINCGEPSPTCFCTTMGTGPAAGAGADLVLTEILSGEHRFLIEARTEEGAEVLAGLQTAIATSRDIEDATQVTVRAAEQMAETPSFDASGVHDLLLRNLENPRFDEVATRCLNCTNCTLVCPTCFCTSVEDTNDLAVGEVERTRVWDSCFSITYSEMHGGATRQSPRSRYRQWLVHKLATWHDQFDSSGCVGCGRCITWCPAGIDLREEVRAIESSEEVPA